MENKFDQELLGKIKENKLMPKPRWHFLLKDYVIWGVGAITLLVGSTAMSVTIYLVKNDDWNIYRDLDNNPIKFILVTLPYFWLIFLVLFVFILYYDFKHTKRGYHYSFISVAAASIVLSIILGGAFFKFGLGQYIDDVLGERAPFYKWIVNSQINYWDDPDQGRLIGLIISISQPDEFGLQDTRNKQWTVKLEQKTMFPPDIIIVGKPVRIIGKEMSENIFSAFRLLPVGPGRGMFRGHRPPPPLNYNDLEPEFISYGAACQSF